MHACPVGHDGAEDCGEITSLSVLVPAPGADSASTGHAIKHQANHNELIALNIYSLACQSTVPYATLGSVASTESIEGVSDISGGVANADANSTEADAEAPAKLTCPCAKLPVTTGAT